MIKLFVPGWPLILHITECISEAYKPSSGTQERHHFINCTLFTKRRFWRKTVTLYGHWWMVGAELWDREQLLRNLNSRLTSEFGSPYHIALLSLETLILAVHLFEQDIITDLPWYMNLSCLIRCCLNTS